MADRICSIPDCGRPTVGRGWCRRHYSRWHKHGDPLYVTPWKPRPQNRPRTTGCSVDGCEDKHHAKGFCRGHYSQNWCSENPERVSARQAEYRAANREIARERSRVWRIANPERFRELNRRYHAENPDKIRAAKRLYREANRDKIRASNNRRKAMHRGVAVNDLIAQQWTDIKAAYRQRCAYCGKRPKKLTMDHVVPLSKGGHHTASNIIPACGPCNSRKGDRDAPTFQPLLM